VFLPGVGHVIIETNFRIYAHSSSDLRARVLRSFAHLSYQLPGLIVGSLTRQSVQVRHCNRSSLDINYTTPYYSWNCYYNYTIISTTTEKTQSQTIYIRRFKSHHHRLERGKVAQQVVERALVLESNATPTTERQESSGRLYQLPGRIVGSLTRQSMHVWPLHDIAITNIVWCMV